MRSLTLEITAFVSILVALFFGSVAVVHAVDHPSFPSCPNPSGTVLATYADGVHGIVGDAGVYTGSDTVTQVNSSQVTQCFCPSSGSGIQTNWLKASNFSSDEKATAINQGWIYIEEGSAWGLDQGDWLAKNNTFSCGEQGGSTNDPGSSSGSSSSSSSSSDSGSSSSSVSSFIPQILGFADTGFVRLWRSILLLAGSILAVVGLVVFFLLN